MREKISNEAAIKTNQWTGYKPLEKEFKKIKHIKPDKKGENFLELHRVIMNFKG